MANKSFHVLCKFPHHFIENQRSFEDIWASIEKNINENSAAAIKRKNNKFIVSENYQQGQSTNEDPSDNKASISCVPLPSNENIRKISTGTSPPPQNISTQVFLFSLF